MIEIVSMTFLSAQKSRLPSVRLTELGIHISGIQISTPPRRTMEPLNGTPHQKHLHEP